MEIKTKSTFQEKMDAAIIMRKLSGMLSKDNKRYRIIYTVCFLIGLFDLYVSLRINGKSSVVLSSILIVFSSLNVIFANKINIKNIRRNVKRYYKTVSKQYNYDFTESTEVTIKIDGDYLEVATCGVITKYSLKEYVRYFAESYFYVFEFNNGKYLFMNKNDFPDMESLRNFENAILNNKI